MVAIRNFNTRKIDILGLMHRPIVHHKPLTIDDKQPVSSIYLFCCAACWFLVQRDVRADVAQPFNFPGMKIVPALAIIAIIWILAHATAWEFEVNGIVLAIATILYFVRAKLR